MGTTTTKMTTKRSEEEQHNWNHISGGFIQYGSRAMDDNWATTSVSANQSGRHNWATTSAYNAPVAPRDATEGAQQATLQQHQFSSVLAQHLVSACISSKERKQHVSRNRSSSSSSSSNPQQQQRRNFPHNSPERLGWAKGFKTHCPAILALQLNSTTTTGGPQGGHQGDNNWAMTSDSDNCPSGPWGGRQGATITTGQRHQIRNQYSQLRSATTTITTTIRVLAEMRRQQHNQQHQQDLLE